MKANFNDDWDSDGCGVHNEINVTPFIDVVLVLLIVFMVAAPLATSVIPVQLPSITQAPSVVQPDEPLYITLQKDHSLYIGNHLITPTEFKDVLFRETNRNLETKILIKADSEIDYGAVVDLLNQIKTAGYRKVGLMGLSKSAHVAYKKGGREAGSNDAGHIAGDVGAVMRKEAEGAAMVNSVNSSVMDTVSPAH
ncbi:biopolymer transport protein ExbD [Bartonella silvatica]|uniref:Biopolymer transport protein ExbD n=1 Tax=Bartonella silvatica TaxID=357760 RepID=A0ABV2HH29_9HYPH